MFALVCPTSKVVRGRDPCALLGLQTYFPMDPGCSVSESSQVVENSVLECADSLATVGPGASKIAGAENRGIQDFAPGF